MSSHRARTSAVLHEAWVPQASFLRLGFSAHHAANTGCKLTRRVPLLCAAVLLIGALTPALAQRKPPIAPLDLNAATLEQLTALPGVGPATAKAIVDFRQKSGPFRRVEDLLAIRGITDRRLKELRPYITVRPAKNAGLPAPDGAILCALHQGGDPWQSPPARG